MQNSFPILFLFLVSGFGASVVHGQTQRGFISIDCGSREKFSFIDLDTGISYNSDEAYVGTGENKNISAEFSYPKNPVLPQPLSDLRCFPQGNKNCYTLKPTGGKGSLNLIRASFLYGNYDGQGKPPEFDIYLDVSLWSSISFINASNVVTTEAIFIAQADIVNVCLVNKGMGVPFISGLELRPLLGSIYGEAGKSSMLVLFKRLDIGSNNGTGRYSDDVYDRIWTPYKSPLWEPVNSDSAVDDTGNGYRAPQEVLKTGASPRNGSLELSWTTTNRSHQFYVFMYFAEPVQLKRNQSRMFNVSWNGNPLFGPIRNRPLFATTISNSRPLVGEKQHQISIYKIGDSTLPPILNAIEIYLKKQTNLITTIGDVDAMMNIKATYQVNKDWIGDPCGPKNYSWKGLECIFNESSSPRIISLNLASTGLSGQIASSIANLTSLETLDLSNNSLNGEIPSFLEKLAFLKFLNLTGNHLSGPVPEALHQRWKAGSLTLSVDSHNLCTSSQCGKRKNIVIPIVVTISSVLVLVVASIIIWRIRRNKMQEATIANAEGRDLVSKNRRFSCDEIVNITNNFQKSIGRGGFGTVYLGHTEDGTQVAVKLLSSSSSQGSKEFLTEAELLMRVHHRNLVSLVGYCNSGNRVALIYEYMANGNLKHYISGENGGAFSWEARLRVAIDAAQGLEYLHHGCKPPIIHRDVKSANILLSETLEAKIADFGLSRTFPNDGQVMSVEAKTADFGLPKTFPSHNFNQVMTQVMGTTGYLDPEYYITQKLNEKSDVYSFGIVLFELICGKPAVIKGEEEEPMHIVHWVQRLIKRGEVTGLVDGRLEGDYETNSVGTAVDLAVACTAATSIHRPTMSHVMAKLKECLELEMSRERMGRTERNVLPVNEDDSYCSYHSTEANNSSTGFYSTDFDSTSGPIPRK